MQGSADGFTLRVVQVDGRPLSVNVGGPVDAPAVVLVHGLLIGGDYFLPTALALAGRYRVYVPDLPGSGRSAPAPAELDVPGLARALQATLEALSVDAAHLVGNSAGCAVVARMAADHPTRVRSVALVGPAPIPVAWVLPQMILFFLTGLFEPPILPVWIIAAALHHGLRGSVEAIDYALSYRIDLDLSRMSTRALVVRGRLDLISSAAWASRAATLARGRLVTVRSAHAVNYTSPALLADLLGPFFEG